MAGENRRRRRKWSQAFQLIRAAMRTLQSDECQSEADKIPPEEIGRIQEVVSDLQETIVDLERLTNERFYFN